ncbi:MAG: hypothetical protein HY817_03330 [Candidatus Abawacabacteria bacterium]|nr:hypothetical protein [Candidatus Abawacabacteria bacterium]
MHRLSETSEPPASVHYELEGRVRQYFSGPIRIIQDRNAAIFHIHVQVAGESFEIQVMTVPMDNHRFNIVKIVHGEIPICSQFNSNFTPEKPEYVGLTPCHIEQIAQSLATHAEQARQRSHIRRKAQSSVRSPRIFAALGLGIAFLSPSCVEELSSSSHAVSQATMTSLPSILTNGAEHGHTRRKETATQLKQTHLPKP